MKREGVGMIEFRIHGRGGQGNVAAAYLLAAAAFESGRMCQAFPSFGAERRGAPVTAFVRIDDRPIDLRAQVQSPDYLIIQDDKLLHDGGITNGLKFGGAMIVNSTQEAAELSRQFGCKVFCLPANKMAMETIGRPIPNAALLASFLTLLPLFPLDDFKKALRGKFSGEMLDKNLILADLAADYTPKSLWQEVQNA
jgi:pyruvate ferredoxin oxidoreductase gamma subunit